MVLNRNRRDSVQLDTRREGGWERVGNTTGNLQPGGVRSWIWQQDRLHWSRTGHGQTSVSRIYTPPDLFMPLSLYFPVMILSNSKMFFPCAPYCVPCPRYHLSSAQKGIRVLRLDDSPSWLSWDSPGRAQRSCPSLRVLNMGSGLPLWLCSHGLGEMGIWGADGSCGGPGSSHAGFGIPHLLLPLWALS